jgi:hypothetical protein
MRKAVPLPRMFPELLHGAQSIEIKYFQQGVFGEHFNRYPLPLFACAA